MRGSGRGDGKPLQLLSAVSHRLRLTVAQLAIAEKSNEIPALQPMLETLPCLEGSVITADAMQCQQQAARYLTQQRGADYLFGLKANQEGILERAQVKLPQDFFPCEYDTGWSKEHGRLQRWRFQRKETTPELSSPDQKLTRDYRFQVSVLTLIFPWGGQLFSPLREWVASYSSEQRV